MSIAAFYRTYIPFVQEWSYYDRGVAVNAQTVPTWVKVNVQPFKQGLMFDLKDVGTVYNDWKTIYTRVIPVYDLEGIPKTATLNKTYAYYNGKWYAVTATQDWTTPGRAPKHYKYLAVAPTGSGAITWPEPIPFATLVENFEAAVRELQQTSIVFTQLTQEN